MAVVILTFAQSIVASVAVGLSCMSVIIVLVEIRRRSARKHKDVICPHCGGRCVLVPLLVHEDPAQDTVMCDKCMMTMPPGVAATAVNEGRR